MQKYKVVFGIDVSKDNLDIVNRVNNSEVDEHYFQVKNKVSVLQKWLAELSVVDKSSTLFVLEPTGTYSSKIIAMLHQAGFKIALVTPLKSDGFSKALGVVSKNDHQAASNLAMMGTLLKLSLYQAPSEIMQKKKQVHMGLKALNKQAQQLHNQLHAMDQMAFVMPQVKEALQTSLQVVKEQIAYLEAQLEELDEKDDEAYHQQMKLLTSVVGIGEKTARLLYLATGGIHHFDFSRQVSKFVGLIPYSHHSGTSVRVNGRMTKRGNNQLRATLYMAARSAIRYNLACKELYERLRAKGKPYKKAMVAVMNKLVRQAFGCVNSGTPFDNRHYLKFKEN